MARTTRWCPTPEQLMILEELYRGGLRTPKAPLIQDITAHLSLYGKIEGKNVFYWFQNHKARDKQKLRRKMMRMQLLQQRLSFQQQPLSFQQYNQQFPHQSFLPPLFPPTFHQLPSHGSSAMFHQV
ncbi:hypothetical protein Leryth_009541 [Lithospermum erythrorhizon]|nr:hypothetical protein Leryth_009541 [Lithospermum erythrorhizon]